MVYIVFGIIFALMVIGILIEIWEILPTLSKKRGEKVEAPYFHKARQQQLEEYHRICKELNKSLVWYHYINCFDKYTVHMIIIFLIVSLFPLIMAIF